MSDWASYGPCPDLWNLKTRRVENLSRAPKRVDAWFLASALMPTGQKKHSQYDIGISIAFAQESDKREVLQDSKAVSKNSASLLYPAPFCVRRGATPRHQMNPAEAAHGPGLIGAFLNVFLLGIMVTQVYFYASTYKHDRLWIRIFIFILLIADITNSVFDIYWLYTDIILNFGNAQALGIADWRIATDPAMVAIIATMVQLFFAWRVKVLTGNIWITGLIVVTAIVSCCGGLGVAIAIHFVKLFENFYKFDQIGTIWLISTAVCDTAIALTLTWHLKKHKTGISRTDDILDRIVRLTVQNGAITAIWAIVDLILFLSIPTGVHLALNLPLAKLYTNSLMSSLNARSAWRFNPESTDKYGANTLGTAKSAPMPDFVKLGANTQTHAQAVVTVEQHELNDIEARGDDGQWSERSAGHEGTSYKSKPMVL